MIDGSGLTDKGMYEVNEFIPISCEEKRDLASVNNNPLISRAASADDVSTNLECYSYDVNTYRRAEVRPIRGPY